MVDWLESEVHIIKAVEFINTQASKNSIARW